MENTTTDYVPAELVTIPGTVKNLESTHGLDTTTVRAIISLFAVPAVGTVDKPQGQRGRRAIVYDSGKFAECIDLVSKNKKG